MSSKILSEYNRAKIKLINKYLKQSKNLSRMKSYPNTFISINDFLAEEISLGPNAGKGDIDYSLYDPTNTHLFINQLIKDINFDSIICKLENVYIKYINPATIGKYECHLNSIIYNMDRDEMIIPMNLKDEINRCSNSKRFVYIYFGITWIDTLMGHANMLLIDNLNKTIERFEPYGKNMPSDKKKNYQQSLDKKFSQKTLDILNLQNYKYISPEIFIPSESLQVKADAYDGMCVTYCMIYLQLRIMNPDVDRKLIIKYLLSKSKKEILDIILRYARYIENTLKDNSNNINKYLNNFYGNECNQKSNYLIINFKNDYIFDTW